MLRAAILLGGERSGGQNVEFDHQDGTDQGKGCGGFWKSIFWKIYDRIHFILCYVQGFLCPDIPRKKDGGASGSKYVGATVLTPVVGAHFEPIAVLDFASLYPSIIRAENFCFSTIVMDPRYASLEGVEYQTVEVPGMGTYSYALNVEKGVIPSLLEDLLDARKASRKLSATAKADGMLWEAALYDAQQLAYKVSANSVYGALGATTSALSCPPLAASVTTVGRGMLEQAGKLALEKVPGSVLIYGDTVRIGVWYIL